MTPRHPPRALRSLTTPIRHRASSISKSSVASQSLGPTAISRSSSWDASKGSTFCGDNNATTKTYPIGPKTIPTRLSPSPAVLFLSITYFRDRHRIVKERRLSKESPSLAAGQGVRPSMTTARHRIQRKIIWLLVILADQNQARRNIPRGKPA